MLWDVATWEEKIKLKDNDGAFGHATFSPDGKVLAATDYFRSDGVSQVKLWNTRTGKPLGILKEEAGRLIRNLVFSPDGKTLVLGIYTNKGDDTVRLWDWAEKKANGSFKLEGKECRAIRFTRDGKTYVTLNEHGEITFSDFESGQVQRTVKASARAGVGWEAARVCPVTGRC